MNPFMSSFFMTSYKKLEDYSMQLSVLTARVLPSQSERKSIAEMRKGIDSICKFLNSYKLKVSFGTRGYIIIHDSRQNVIYETKGKQVQK